MKTRLFLSSTTVLAAALLTGSVHSADPAQQEVNSAAIAVLNDSATLVPDLTIAPADKQIAFANHESHSSHASHASHSSHTSGSVA